MRSLLADYDRLHAAEQVGRAVVTSTWGSAPQAEGAVMLVAEGGRMAGSVSGGCVEAAVAEEVVAAIKRGSASVLRFGVSHERAFEVGLSCGGTIELLIQPSVPEAVLAAARGSGTAVVATALEGPSLGHSKPFADHPAAATEAGRVAAERARRTGRSGTIRIPVDGIDAACFLESMPAPPRIVIFGAVHIAAALVTLARPLGFRTVVADGRSAFLTHERFPDADELVLGWPEEALGRAGLDADTSVVVLTHDPKFDDPALLIALRSDAGYVGAIGSRTTQASRRDRLRKAGLTEEQLARLHGPVGLDLGGRTPAETALAILAEITANRFGGEIVRRRGQPGED